IHNKWNFSVHYTNAANAPLCKVNIPVFLCPSNSITQVDQLGYGFTDYMPVAYCDISPTTGLRDKSVAPALNSDRAGALGFCKKIADCSDGLSNTVLVFEDANRPTQTAGHYDQSTI